MSYNHLRAWVLCAACIVAAASGMTAVAADGAADDAALRNTQENRDAEKLKHHEPDFSGKKRTGKASFYAKQFAGKLKMRAAFIPSAVVGPSLVASAVVGSAVHHAADLGPGHHSGFHYALVQPDRLPGRAKFLTGAGPASRPC